MIRLTLIGLLISGCVFGQQPSALEKLDQNPRTSFKDRLYVGGDANVFFGNTYSIISVAPIVGYKITDELSAGVGAKYQWFRDRLFDYTDNIFGGSVFSRYLIGANLLAHAELEMLNVRDYSFFAPADTRTLASMFFVGGGYRQGMGGSYLTVMLLYDLIDDPNSPYQFQYLVNGLPLILRGGLVISL